MEKPIMMKPEVFDALQQIQQKNIKGSLYRVVSNNEKAFLEMGISLEDLTDLLDMKQNAEDYPEPDFYQVYDEWRITYIQKNMTNPVLKLHGDNERAYLTAVRMCDSWRIDYEEKADEFSKIVSNGFEALGIQQKKLEQEGLSSWKGIKYQVGKAMEKIGVLLWGENEPENSEQSEPKVGKMIDRNVMVDNYRLWALTDEQKMASDQVTVLYRIRANKDINSVFGVDVVKGELGGWVESENNLEGNSWVGDNAEVYGRAKVVDSAVIENAIVKDDARVSNDSCIAGNAHIMGSACVENSIVTDDAWINDYSVIVNTPVDGYSSVSGESYLYDCTCSVNTHIVSSKIQNVDMSGDIYIDSSTYGYGEGAAERDYVDYVRPALLDADLLKKLRASQENGLVGAVVCGNEEMEFIADLNLVKGKYLPMDLFVSQPVIRCNRKLYDGQKILDKLKELHCPISDMKPERLMDMLAGKPQPLGTHTCSIRQVGEEFILETVTEDVAEELADTNYCSQEESEQADLGMDEHKLETEVADKKQKADVMQESIGEKYPANVKLKSLFIFSGEEKLASDQVTVLHRIQANRNLSFINEKDVPEGTLGGWIESDKNLSGYSWVGDDAEVYGQARIINSAVLGSSIIRGNAIVKESTVWGNSLIKDDAEVEGSLVSGHAQIGGSSILERSVFIGYGSVSGDSHVDNCFCRKNVNIANSWLRYVNMEGDFMLNGEKLDCETEGGKLKSFGYTPPVLIVDSMLEQLRAHPEGLKGVSLCEVEGKKFIADLNLVGGADMRMKLAVSNPVIRCNGINYSGQKVTDGLEKLSRDIIGIHPDRLSRMMTGEPVSIRSVSYVIQQKGNEYELADLRKRVKNIEIYSLKDGGMSIRCTIDGIQQSGKKMSAETLRAFNDQTDRRALAVDYFMNELRENREVEYSMRR